MPYFEIGLKWDVFAEGIDAEQARERVELRIREMIAKGDWAIPGGLGVVEVRELLFAPSAVAGWIKGESEK